MSHVSRLAAQLVALDVDATPWRAQATMLAALAGGTAPLFQARAVWLGAALSALGADGVASLANNLMVLLRRAYHTLLRVTLALGMSNSSQTDDVVVARCALSTADARRRRSMLQLARATLADSDFALTVATALPATATSTASLLPTRGSSLSALLDTVETSLHAAVLAQSSVAWCRTSSNRQLRNALAVAQHLVALLLPVAERVLVAVPTPSAALTLLASSAIGELEGSTAFGGVRAYGLPSTIINDLSTRLPLAAARLAPLTCVVRRVMQQRIAARSINALAIDAYTFVERGEPPLSAQYSDAGNAPVVAMRLWCQEVIDRAKLRSS